MEIATASSFLENSSSAAEEAWSRLRSRLSGHPSLLLAYYTEQHDPETLAATLSALAPSVPLHGGSSCLGLLTDEGFLGGNGVALGLWGLHDPEGDYGVGISPQLEQPRQAAAQALQDALQQADRPGESPSLIWLNAAPGQEEEILAGIESVVGPNVPVMGGSTADNEILGHWSQLANNAHCTDGVVLSVMFSSRETGLSFHSGYIPTSSSGVVTSAERRTIHRIDHRPAADVYNEWTGGVLKDLPPDGGNVLPLTTWHPLGRVRQHIGGIPRYVLSHPERILPDKSLTLFSAISEGEEVVLMSGSREGLLKRAGRVAEGAVADFTPAPGCINGALMVYCAGTMLAVQDEIHRIKESLVSAVGDVPFLTVFTFGEQGYFAEGANHHGNLMISVGLFSDLPSVI